MGKKLIFGILPIILLVAVVIFFLRVWSPVPLSTSSAPIEELVTERVLLSPDRMEIHIRNDGPDDVQIAQVLVNGSYWAFHIDTDRPLGRLAKAVISIDYPWNEGDDQHVTIVTRSGVTFPIEVPAAANSIELNIRAVGALALIGFLIGVVPVLIGLLWFPFMRGLKSNWYSFFLALTVGLLVFLGFDAIEESLETASAAPKSFNGVGVLIIGFFLSFLLLFFLSRGRKNREGGNYQLAFSIALGIGLHNLGEGLAVGSAYAIGNISLGTALVVGFIIHNITEGLPIIAPLAKTKTSVSRLLLLGLLAGAPAIVGTWIGGFAFSAIWAVLFLGFGAGAIFQVAIEIIMQIRKSATRSLYSLPNVAGFVVGLVVMYGTGLLVAV